MDVEQSRKRRLSVTPEDGQTSRGPENEDSSSVRVHPKIRKMKFGSKPYKIDKFTTDESPRRHKRAYSDSDISTGYADTRGKKRCFSTPEEIEGDEKQNQENEDPTRRRRTRRGRRKQGLLKYEIGELLGSGRVADVYAARRKRDNLPVAIKFLHKSNVRNYREMDDQEFPIEAFYQRHVSHPNVIELLEVFKHRDYFVFVLERPENSSDLFDFLDEHDFLTEDEGRKIFTNILDATIECEKQGVYHRDIKPENIILDLTKMEAKLTDFSLACDERVMPLNYFVGAKHYCPPEFYSQKSFFGNQATMWQLGFLLTEMLTGEIPYDKPRMALHMKPSIAKHVSEEARSLISWMLSRDPDERPTLQQVRRHAWINNTRQC